MTAAALTARFAASIVELTEQEDELRLVIAGDSIAQVCAYLRDALGFDYPADLTARDTGEEILLWYRLYSIATRKTVTIEATLPRAGAKVESVTPIWPGMSFHERECFDMLGIEFIGHPDSDTPSTMRILLPEDWEGHPFRKDYEPEFPSVTDPLHGPQEAN